MKQVNCVIIGYGSIGARHARILDGLGAHVGVVCGHSCGPYQRFESIGDALKEGLIDYVIIANETVAISRL